MTKPAKIKSAKPTATGGGPALTAAQWSEELGTLSESTLLRKLRRRQIHSRDGKYRLADVLAATYTVTDKHAEQLIRLKTEGHVRALAELQRTDARAQDLEAAGEAFQLAVIAALKDAFSFLFAMQLTV